MPTKEQILEATATSPEAKQALEKLFPEYFNTFVNLTITECRIVYSYEGCSMIRVGNGLLPEEYNYLKDKCFILHGYYEWELIKTELGHNILIPTKKHYHDK